MTPRGLGKIAISCRPAVASSSPGQARLVVQSQLLQGGTGYRGWGGFVWENQLPSLPKLLPE